MEHRLNNSGLSPGGWIFIRLSAEYYGTFPGEGLVRYFCCWVPRFAVRTAFQTSVSNMDSFTQRFHTWYYSGAHRLPTVDGFPGSFLWDSFFLFSIWKIVVSGTSLPGGCSWGGGGGGRGEQHHALRRKALIQGLETKPDCGLRYIFVRSEKIVENWHNIWNMS